MRQKIIITMQLVNKELQVPKKRKLIYSFIFKRIKLIAISQNNLNIISERFNISQSFIISIPNGVTLKEYERISEQRKAELRLELNIKKDDVVIIFPARISTQKDHETMLQAISKLNNDVRKKIKILCPGDSKMEYEHAKKIFALTEKFDLQHIVFFLGHRTDILELYQISDIFLLSTHSEGQPFSILEAMFMGIPIIASAVSGIPEIIRDKFNGLLFEEYDYLKLTEIIDNTVNQQYNFDSFIENAKLTAKQYSLDNMLLQTEEVYQLVKKI
jgi:glycosyltransferase involved in cell wall biosynthesis